jgi:hypothetical protein
MKKAALDDIEKRIEKLTQEEQLHLIERLAQGLRRGQTRRRPPRPENLAAMAADPQIQAQLRLIEEEFRGTAADGLEKL